MNARQKQIQTMIDKYVQSININPETNLRDFSEVDKDVIRSLEEVKGRHADSPAKDYHRTAEEKELGFHPAGTKGIIGCSTIPCCGGKMPNQALPVSMCTIGQTMCDISPLQSMRECKVFEKIEDGLKEQKRLTRNDQAIKRYHARNKIK